LRFAVNGIKYGRTVLARLCCGVAVLERLLRMCCVVLCCSGFRGPRRQIFFQDPARQRVAESYIAQLTRAAVFPGPIVTKVAPDFGFFPAEQYHQDFMNSNPSNPYISINDMPTLHDLKQLFPALYGDQPVLTLASGWKLDRFLRQK
jgi:Peptide methionine sulfoxide reductase